MRERRAGGGGGSGDGDTAREPGDGAVVGPVAVLRHWGVIVLRGDGEGEAE